MLSENIIETEEANVIRATGKGVTDIDLLPVALATKCRLLYVSYNSIQTLENITQFKFLTDLLIEFNLISRIEDLLPLAELPNLTILRLDGNPVCSLPLFIYHILLICPNLKSINGRKVTLIKSRIAQNTVNYIEQEKLLLQYLLFAEFSRSVISFLHDHPLMTCKEAVGYIVVPSDPEFAHQTRVKGKGMSPDAYINFLKRAILNTHSTVTQLSIREERINKRTANNHRRRVDRIVKKGWENFNEEVQKLNTDALALIGVGDGASVVSSLSMRSGRSQMSTTSSPGKRSVISSARSTASLKIKRRVPAIIGVTDEELNALQQTHSVRDEREPLDIMEFDSVNVYKSDAERVEQSTQSKQKKRMEADTNTSLPDLTISKLDSDFDRRRSSSVTSSGSASQEKSVSSKRSQSAKSDSSRRSNTRNNAGVDTKSNASGRTGADLIKELSEDKKSTASNRSSGRKSVISAVKERNSSASNGRKRTVLAPKRSASDARSNGSARSGRSDQVYGNQTNKSQNDSRDIGAEIENVLGESSDITKSGMESISSFVEHEQEVRNSELIDGGEVSNLSNIEKVDGRKSSHGNKDEDFQEGDEEDKNEEDVSQSISNVEFDFEDVNRSPSGKSNSSQVKTGDIIEIEDELNEKQKESDPLEPTKSDIICDEASDEKLPVTPIEQEKDSLLEEVSKASEIIEEGSLERPSNKLFGQWNDKKQSSTSSSSSNLEDEENAFEKVQNEDQMSKQSNEDHEESVDSKEQSDVQIIDESRKEEIEESSKDAVKLQERTSNESVHNKEVDEKKADAQKKVDEKAVSSKEKTSDIASKETNKEKTNDSRGREVEKNDIKGENSKSSEDNADSKISNAEHSNQYAGDNEENKKHESAETSESNSDKNHQKDDAAESIENKNAERKEDKSAERKEDKNVERKEDKRVENKEGENAKLKEDENAEQNEDIIETNNDNDSENETETKVKDENDKSTKAASKSQKKKAGRKKSPKKKNVKSKENNDKESNQEDLDKVENDQILQENVERDESKHNDDNLEDGNAEERVDQTEKEADDHNEISDSEGSSSEDEPEEEMAKNGDDGKSQSAANTNINDEDTKKDKELAKSPSSKSKKGARKGKGKKSMKKSTKDNKKEVVEEDKAKEEEALGEKENIADDYQINQMESKEDKVEENENDLADENEIEKEKEDNIPDESTSNKTSGKGKGKKTNRKKSPKKKAPSSSDKPTEKESTQENEFNTKPVENNDSLDDDKAVDNKEEQDDKKQEKAPEEKPKKNTGRKKSPKKKKTSPSPQKGKNDNDEEKSDQKKEETAKMNTENEKEPKDTPQNEDIIKKVVNLITSEFSNPHKDDENRDDEESSESSNEIQMKPNTDEAKKNDRSINQPENDISKEATSNNEKPKQSDKKYDSSKNAVPKSDSQKNDSSKNDTPKNIVPKSGVTKNDAQKNDSSKNVVPMNDTTKNDAQKNDASKNEKQVASIDRKQPLSQSQQKEKQPASKDGNKMDNPADRMQNQFKETPKEEQNVPQQQTAKKEASCNTKPNQPQPEKSAQRDEPKKSVKIDPNPHFNDINAPSDNDSSVSDDSYSDIKGAMSEPLFRQTPISPSPNTLINENGTIIADGNTTENADPSFSLVNGKSNQQQEMNFEMDSAENSFSSRLSTDSSMFEVIDNSPMRRPYHKAQMNNMLPNSSNYGKFFSIWKSKSRARSSSREAKINQSQANNNYVGNQSLFDKRQQSTKKAESDRPKTIAELAAKHNLKRKIETQKFLNESMHDRFDQVSREYETLAETRSMVPEVFTPPSFKNPFQLRTNSRQTELKPRSSLKLNQPQENVRISNLELMQMSFYAGSK